MNKDIVLYTKDHQVFCEIGKDYLLYLASESIIEILEARDIILLIDLVISEHVKGARIN